MPGDPQIYKDTAEAGHIRHTFTGIRKEFPNKAIHYLIINDILPVRREMFLRPELQQEGRWNMELVTLVQQGLDSLSINIKQVTHRENSETLNMPLAERIKKQAEFRERANSKANTLEQLAQDVHATHADVSLQQADLRISALHFDFTGEDPDYPQPTPGRMPNHDGRSLIVGLDRLLVQMTVSHSADHPRTINEYDASLWQAKLADLFTVAANAGSEQSPYLPTGFRRSQLDNVWNADGAHDPPINQGSGQQGSVPTAQ